MSVTVIVVIALAVLVVGAFVLFTKKEEPAPTNPKPNDIPSWTGLLRDIETAIVGLGWSAENEKSVLESFKYQIESERDNPDFNAALSKMLAGLRN